jgi:hypothetical protein
MVDVRHKVFFRFVRRRCCDRKKGKTNAAGPVCGARAQNPRRASNIASRQLSISPNARDVR